VPDEEPAEHRANESFAVLTIYSDANSAEELSDLLGVAPDEAWNRGDDWKRGKTRTTTAISLRSRVPDASPPEDHLDDLVTRIEPLSDRLTQIAAGNSVRLKVAVFADTDNPTLGFPAEVLRRVGSLGLDLELDIYEV
jgi:Domain of unknown function (DUF4279)